MAFVARGTGARRVTLRSHSSRADSLPVPHHHPNVSGVLMPSDKRGGSVSPGCGWHRPGTIAHAIVAAKNLPGKQPRAGGSRRQRYPGQVLEGWDGEEEWGIESARTWPSLQLYPILFPMVGSVFQKKKAN